MAATIELTQEHSRSLVDALAGLFAVDDVTVGVAPGNSVRLRGQLLLPAEEAYPALDGRLRPLGFTPLLRNDPERGADRSMVLAMPIIFKPARQRVALAAVLFALTALSCLYVGALNAEEASGWLPANLLHGWSFAVSLLSILVAHEFGHYIVARRLGEPVSLPYFVPLPLPPLGTLGAVINMTAPPRNRRHLLAIGAAGPLAGLLVAIPVLWIGLGLSQVLPLPNGPYAMEGNSLLYAAIKFLRFGRLLPGGGYDVFIHPVALAGWAGLLVTSLNLIPVGQLDGGHILQALLGENALLKFYWVALAAVVGLAFISLSWVIWAGLIFLFGRMVLPPLDSITVLKRRDRVLAIAMLVVFVLVFIPVPWREVIPH